MVSSADVPASALDGGSWALGASHACMCSWPAVLPGCVLCSCSRCACLCTHLWGGKRSFAREEPICVCPMQTLHRGLSGHQKRHCSGAFRSHDIIYGLSEALWTLAISLECLKVAVRCIESRYLLCTLNLGIRPKTRQGERLLPTCVVVLQNDPLSAAAVLYWCRRRCR